MGPSMRLHTNTRARTSHTLTWVFSFRFPSFSVDIVTAAAVQNKQKMKWDQRQMLACLPTCQCVIEAAQSTHTHTTARTFAPKARTENAKNNIDVRSARVCVDKTRWPFSWLGMISITHWFSSSFRCSANKSLNPHIHSFIASHVAGMSRIQWIQK